MTAAIYTQGGNLEILYLPKPELEEGDALLRVEAASFCGTDTKILRVEHRKLLERQRIVLGHEFAGVTEEVRGSTGNLRPGMRVGVAPNLRCGQCPACVRGLANYYPDYSAFVIETDGAHAEYVRLPAKAIPQGNVVELPEDLALEEASVAEPLSCVVNAQAAVGLAVGDKVAGYGCGPMGLLHIILARAAGAQSITAIDPNPDRLEMARAAGASVVISSDRESVTGRVRDHGGTRRGDHGRASGRSYNRGLETPVTVRPALSLRRFNQGQAKSCIGSQRCALQKPPRYRNNGWQ